MFQFLLFAESVYPAFSRAPSKYFFTCFVVRRLSPSCIYMSLGQMTSFVPLIISLSIDFRFIYGSLMHYGSDPVRTTEVNDIRRNANALSISYPAFSLVDYSVCRSDFSTHRRIPTFQPFRKLIYDCPALRHIRSGPSYPILTLSSNRFPLFQIK